MGKQIDPILLNLLLVGAWIPSRHGSNVAIATTTDNCTGFQLNCLKCLQVDGCYYCPADGLCLSDPWALSPKLLQNSRCAADDFLSDSTCDPVDLYRNVSAAVDGSVHDWPFFRYGIF